MGGWSVAGGGGSVAAVTVGEKQDLAVAAVYAVCSVMECT